MSIVGFTDRSPPLNLSPTGAMEWGRMMDLMDKAGFAGEMDRQALYAYCEAFQEFDDLVGKVKKTGPLIKTEKGNWIQSPLLCAKNKASERMLKAAKDFGLTPWARSKMDCLERDAQDEFSKFLNEH